MPEDEEPEMDPPARPLPFRPLRRRPARPAEGQGVEQSAAADDLGWLALLELTLDEEMFRRR
jgi:hypothetical protein